MGRLVSVRPVPDAGGVVLDLGRPEDDPFAGRGAAADGSAPEGGTASSASAKVPVGRLAPRRPRTPTEEGIQRRGTCRDSRWCSFPAPSDAVTGRLGCAGRLGRVEFGSAPAASARAAQRGGSSHSGH